MSGSEDRDPAVRPPPDLSFHGLTISPERPAVKAEALPPPAAGFTFIRELGRGGMGVVYEAVEDATGRHVALKIIARRLVGSPDAVERFEREARLAASIAHPNCVFVYGSHTIGGATAISMELMSGRTLEDRIRSGELVPVETAVQWATEILEGLAAAHAMGVVHRDVKPSNCFLTADDHVKVGDFGLSRTVDSDLGLTQSGAFLGSPLYASPEQVRGRAVDQRADVYSAGATLYALLAGRPPHGGSSIGDVLAQIVSEAPPSLSAARPGLPRGLEEVVTRSLAKDPAKRFEDCAAFQRALLPFTPGSLTPATLWLRIIAYVIDAIVFSALFQAVCAALYFAGIRFAGTQEATAWIPSSGMWAWLIPTIINTLYFTIAEGVFGTTLGKRVFNLSVVAVDGSRAPFWRVVIRAFVFFAPSAAPSLFLGPDVTGMRALTRLPTFLFPMVTMRRSNAWRGIHEFASGTRVVRAQPRDLAASGAPALDPARPAATGFPAAIGSYSVEGLVGSTPAGPVLVARDAGLERRVWIHLGGSAGLDPAAAARPAPLRWLHHADSPEPHDVYEAPGGASLLEYSAAGVTFPWSGARAHLGALADELVARGGPLALAQLWIDRGGRFRVLPFAIGDDGGAPLAPGDVLSAVAKRLVAGTTAGPPGLPTDLPLHAEPVLRRLLRLDPEFSTVEEARAALASLAHRPTRLSRMRRAAQLALASTWIGYSGIVLLIAVRAVTERAREKEHITADALDRARGGVSIIFVLAMLFLPTLVLAFALRGGLTFSALGIRIRTRSGELASRLRCLARSFVSNLATLPFLIACFISYRGAWEGLDLMIAGAAASVAVYAGVALWSLRTPSSSLVDRIVRTRLVVR